MSKGKICTLARRSFYPPFFWRNGGLAGLPTVFLEGLLTKLSRMKTPLF